jgi:D-alanyl-D-alanine carboxypeptidase
MSSVKESETPFVPSTTIRWTIYVIVGLTLAGLMLRVTARTVALAQNASPVPSATAPSALVVFPSTATANVVPTSTPLPPTDTPPPTATVVVAATLAAADNTDCAMYSQIAPDLLTVVSKDISLGRDFRPADLAVVPLAQKNQSYQPIPLRRVVHQALLDMLDAMNQAGLSIWVMSGYRSYSDQQLAYDKWQKLYPDRAADISAVPGHSEHQLGTVVDFSTSYMANLYGDFFNVRFSTTPEGQWLSKQAAYYGFTLSYPAAATQITGYAYEPWHYRYVGILAQELFKRNITLTQYIQECGHP